MRFNSFQRWIVPKDVHICVYLSAPLLCSFYILLISNSYRGDFRSIYCSNSYRGPSNELLILVNLPKQEKFSGGEAGIHQTIY